MPVVDGGVILDARIGGLPGRLADFLPQGPGRDGLGDLAIGAADQVPFPVRLHGAQELVGDPHRVVGVLPGHRAVGLAVPVGVVGVELDLLVSLAGELDDAADVVVRHMILARRADGAFQGRVALGLEAVLAGALAIDAGLHDGAQVLAHHLRAGDQGGDLLLFLHLPVHIGLDVGVIDIDNDHLGRPARRASGLDGPGGAVADLQEAEQARRLAAARQRLVLAAQRGEVGAGARAILEQPGLAHPQVHDAAVVDQIVVDRLDEAGVRLGMLVGGFGPDQLAGLEIHVGMALAGAVDAIGPVQAGVEPLRRVGRGHLHDQHVAHLVIEGARVLFRIEVAALPAPVCPCASKAVIDLLGGGLVGGARVLGQILHGLLVGHRAPQPGGDGFFLDPLQLHRHAGLAEILLRQNVRRDLRKMRRNLDVLKLEHQRAVRIADFARRVAKADAFVNVLARCGEMACDFHYSCSPC